MTGSIGRELQPEGHGFDSQPVTPKTLRMELDAFLVLSNYRLEEEERLVYKIYPKVLQVPEG